MEEGARSPLVNASIRSPMNVSSPVTYDSPTGAMIVSPPEFPVKDGAVKSEVKKRKPSAPGSAVKKAKTSESSPTPKSPVAKTPAVSAADEAALPTTEKKKREKKEMTPAARKKKMDALLLQEAELLANIQKLSKEKSKIQSKVKATDEATMKYPVRDDLLFDPNNVRGKSRKVLPVPSVHVDQFMSNDIANDLILVWDFLNVFGKQLALQDIAFEDFAALVRYTGNDCVAINEVFCALLRMVLSDSKNLEKLNLAMPRKVNFSYRSTATADIPMGVTAADLEEADELTVEQLTNMESFDNAYNGFKLLPKRIRADHVDLLRYQSILRCVLLRLAPVKRMRNAVNDVVQALQSQHTTALSSSLLASTYKRIGNIQGAASNVIPASAKTPMSVKFSHLLNRIDTPAGKTNSKAAQAASAAKRELSETAMNRINIPHKVANHRPVLLDKDAIFRITSDVTAPLETIIAAANALETNEVYQLSAKHKVAILKVLVDACYDTSRISQLLESHAEERATKILAMNKTVKDAKEKKKEANNAKRERAVELCRAINKAAAAAKYTSLKRQPPPPAVEPAAGGGGKKKKDALEPSQEQLNNMIEELVLLEALEIDEVVEDIPLEVISEDEEEGAADEEGGENEYFDGDFVKSRPRRNMAAARTKGAERQRIREEKRYFNETIEIANLKLSKALEANSEREVRAAIKAGEKSGLRYDKRGKTYCTQRMKQAYKMLSDLEAKAVEDRAASQHERALQEYFVRTSPLGTDRFHNQYWCFVGDDRLFVQVREEIPAAERTGLIPPANSNDPVSHLYQSRPNRYRYKWSIYSSMTELWYLWDALDDRGERETALKSALKARFDIEEPPTVYQQVGSEYIGRKVKRTFGNRKVVFGTIVGWLPPTDDDIALWHVVHVDGDEEDLELSEVLESLVDESAASASAALANSASPSRDISRVGSRSSLRHAASNHSLVDLSTPVKGGGLDREVAVVLDSASPEEENLPRIIKNNSSLVRGSIRNNAQSISVSGLKFELNRNLNLMSEVLKRLNGAMAREDRKVWETTVRSAETAEELRESLLELEQLVRGVQKTEDRRDVEEEKKRKDAERAEMVEEGWIFDSAVCEVLGSKGRRFFKGFGKSDGEVIGYLPAEKNEGLALYYMQHGDGDVEDLEEADAMRAIKAYLDDQQEEDEEVGEEGEGSDDEEEEGSSAGEEDEESGEEEEQEEREGDGQYTVTLWPTHEVRHRWRDAVSSLHTVGEFALALHAFVEHVTMFGVIVPDEDESEAKPTGARVRKQATVFTPTASHRSSSQRSSKPSSSSSHQEELGKRVRRVVDRSHFSPEKRVRHVREATRKVISYAD